MSLNTIMTETQTMDLNKETAMRLWNAKFGKAISGVDFAGRPMQKAAYNQRGSQYGWNVDHIVPQSHGGKTADWNLEVCNIATNDEKANRWPSFVANGRVFDIVKVENHYEYRERKDAKVNLSTPKPTPNDNPENPNLLDSAAGIRYFKRLKGIQNQHRWVDSAMVRLFNVKTNAVIDLLVKAFAGYSFHFEQETSADGRKWTYIIVRDYDAPLKSDAENLLNQCILANTYLKDYLLPKGYVEAYEILLRDDYYGDKGDMYSEIEHVDFHDIKDTNMENALFITSRIYYSTSACQREKLDFENGPEYRQYDYTYTKLEKNLKKEVEGD